MTFVLYKIQNITNGLFYIGSTSNFYIRKAEHLGELRTNSHCNKALQRDFNRYGERVFIFSIIQDGFKSRQEMLLREYELILKYKGKTYNIDTNCPVLDIHNQGNFHKQFKQKVDLPPLGDRIRRKRKKQKEQDNRKKSIKTDFPHLDKIAQRKAERNRFKNDN